MNINVQVQPMEVREGVEVINICDLFTALNLWGVESEVADNALMAWVEANDASYYAQGREDFFIFEAVNQAIAEGKSRVVVEDLS